MITTRMQAFPVTTTRAQIRSTDSRRVAYTMQNQEAPGGAVITIAPQQTGPGYVLQPGEMLGRDIFAPGSEMWVEGTGACSLVLGEDYEG